LKNYFEELINVHNCSNSLDKNIFSNQNQTIIVSHNLVRLRKYTNKDAFENVRSKKDA
jgi:hypothetical protein